MAGDVTNLKPYQWKPGQSGNPGGRPKGRSLTSILREVLEGKDLCGHQMPDGRTVAQTLVEAALRHAIEGDASLIREVLRRIDGAAPEAPADADDVSRLTDAELIAALTDTGGRGGATGDHPVPGGGSRPGEPAD